MYLKYKRPRRNLPIVNALSSSSTLTHRVAEQVKGASWLFVPDRKGRPENAALQGLHPRRIKNIIARLNSGQMGCIGDKNILAPTVVLRVGCPSIESWHAAQALC